ncbi:hypothetical protein MTO96_013483 [Rhipicephalus appendiculatus]
MGDISLGTQADRNSCRSYLRDKLDRPPRWLGSRKRRHVTNAQGRTDFIIKKAEGEGPSTRRRCVLVPHAEETLDANRIHRKGICAVNHPSAVTCALVPRTAPSVETISTRPNWVQQLVII